jgi:hypothetical protein
MARQKRTSHVLTKAENREAGIRDISEELDLGNGLYLSTYTKEIDQLRDTIFLYNSTLNNLDELARNIKNMERALSITSEKMLVSVGVKYGKDSSEYGKAGGTLTSERKRPSKKNKPVTAAAPQKETIAATASETEEAIVSELIPLKIDTINSNSNGNGKAAKV